MGNLVVKRVRPDRGPERRDADGAVIDVAEVFHDLWVENNKCLFQPVGESSYCTVIF